MTFTAENIVARLVESPLGLIALHADGNGLIAVEIDELSTDQPRADLGRHDGGETRHMLDLAERQLGEYFAGQRTEFDLPVVMSGTDFQLEAWAALSTIGFGETISYAEQARRMGRPGAARAVGSANGRNPIPIIVPCHRVIGADGSLTGYTGGLWIKQFLLDHEQQVGAARSGSAAVTT